MEGNDAGVRCTVRRDHIRLPRYSQRAEDLVRRRPVHGRELAHCEIQLHSKKTETLGRQSLPRALRQSAASLKETTAGLLTDSSALFRKCRSPEEETPALLWLRGTEFRDELAPVRVQTMDSPRPGDERA